MKKTKIVFMGVSGVQYFESAHEVNDVKAALIGCTIVDVEDAGADQIVLTIEAAPALKKKSKKG